MSKFFILGLPRSRTAWMAEYLGCAHEAANYWPSYEEFMKSNVIGDSTTIYFAIKEYTKGHKCVFIHRPVKAVRESLIRLFGVCPVELEEWDKEMRKAVGLHIDFDEIDLRLNEICDYVGVEYDPKKDDFINKNIQNIDLIMEIQSCL